jgi:hypothetical protein
VLAGCATGAIPQQRTYIDRDNRLFDLVLMTVAALDGETLYESRRAGSITASFPGHGEGARLFLDIRLERRADETLVEARAHAGSTEVDPELLELLRERFFAELDARAGGLAPTARPTPAPPWPPSDAPGRG